MEKLLVFDYKIAHDSQYHGIKGFYGVTVSQFEYFLKSFFISHN